MIFVRVKNAIKLLKNNYDFRKCIKRGGGRILRGVRLRIHGNASVGKDVVIGARGIDLFEHTQIVLTPGSSLNIGSHVGMTSVSIFCKSSIEIGDYVNIGAGTLIFDSNFHSLNWQLRADRIRDVKNSSNKPVKIGNHAFIGSRCIIMKGVTIGSKAIIAAGSVVCTDIPDLCVAGGNPCRVIKILKE